MDRSNNRDFIYIYYTYRYNILILYEQTSVLTPSRLGLYKVFPWCFGSLASLLASSLLRDQCSPPILLTIDLLRSRSSSCSCWGCQRRWIEVRRRRIVLNDMNRRRHRYRRKHSHRPLLTCPINHDTVAPLMRELRWCRRTDGWLRHSIYLINNRDVLISDHLDSLAFQRRL